jgi:peptidoglycan/LPS O-acetylase OafA/YrhL
MLKPGQTRFILAFMVILFHLSQSVFLGEFAVGCFFILSGYWISLMYERKYSKIKDTLKVFYISRVWRLLPVFYTFTILAIITSILAHHNLLLKFNELDSLQKSIFLIANLIVLGYANSKNPIIVPAWSLDIEMQFYLLFPLLIYFLRHKKQWLIAATALFFLTAVFILATHQTYLSKTVFNYLFLFFIGVIVYYFNFKPGKVVERVSLLILFAIFAAHLIVPSLLAKARDNSGEYYEVLSLVMILMAVPALINSVHNQTNKFDKFLGEMSFTVYLSHWVWIVPYNALILNASKAARVPYVAGFLLITLLSSYIVYRFIDRPSEKLRHKWIKKQALKSEPEINAAQQQQHEVVVVQS